MKRSLKTQFFVSHLLPVGLMLLALVGAVVSFSHLGRSVDRILQNNYRSVIAAQNMKESLERVDSAAAFRLAGQKELARQQYAEFRPQFEAAYQNEAGNVTEPGEQEQADALRREWAAYRPGVERLLYSPLPDAAARALYFDTLQKQFARMKDQAQQILNLNQAAIVRADERAKHEARRGTLLGIASLLCASLLAVLLAWRLSTALLTPLVSLNRQIVEIAAGHLNGRIDERRSDEIGQLARAFNTMTQEIARARQREAERLHRAERMSAVALADLYDPVVVADASGRVIHLNRAAEGLFGGVKQARGQTVQTVVRDSRLASAIESAAKNAQISAEEGTAAFVTLAERTYRLRATPMRDDDGTDLGAVAVLEDVTYQQEVDRLKTEFIGVASHELRTPVTSLLLGVDLLDEGAAGALAPLQQEIVHALKGDLRRLEQMMRDLLDLTRLEAGAAPPRFELCAPADLIAQARQGIAVQAAAQNIHLQSDVSTDLPLVRADKAQIGRVFLNLLSNALRHTPCGGTVSIGAAAQNNTSQTVRFWVRDTGSGIPAAYQERIFERFVQVPGQTRGGAGLGLSLAQTIVHAHGGVLSVRSEEGAGSTFSFTLPTTAAAPQHNEGNQT